MDTLLSFNIHFNLIILIVLDKVKDNLSYENKLEKLIRIKMKFKI